MQVIEVVEQVKVERPKVGKAPPVEEVIPVSTVAVQQPESEQKPKPVKDVDFSKVVSKVTEFVQSLGTRVSFQYDTRSDNPVIRVFDDESGELIRQIPEEEMLNLMARLRDISGLIFHRSA